VRACVRAWVGGRGWAYVERLRAEGIQIDVTPASSAVAAAEAKM
jgi:precorrin-4 methylase